MPTLVSYFSENQTRIKWIPGFKKNDPRVPPITTTTLVGAKIPYFVHK